MQRTIGKYFGAGIGAVGMAIFIGGIGFLIYLPSVNLSSFGILLILGLGLAFKGFSWHAQIRKFEERNLEWFKKNHTNSCGENGQISCPSCKSNQVRVRGLMQNTYTREHSCGACGTTLFYSPEG